jgi:hypothetical protein
MRCCARATCFGWIAGLSTSIARSSFGVGDGVADVRVARRHDLGVLSSTKAR